MAHSWRMALGGVLIAATGTAGSADSHPAEREALIWRLRPGDDATPRLAYVARLAAGAVAPREGGVVPAGPGRVEIRRSLREVTPVIAGRDLFTFPVVPVQPPRPEVPARFARAGFIDALRTRAGAAVSESFTADPPKHEHYYGLWSAWTATGFEGRAINFWDVRAGTGRVRCEGVDQVWEGHWAGGFTAVNTLLDETVSPPRPVLRETWRVVVYRMPLDAPYDLFDLSLHQACATASPVALREYRYGGLGLKLPAAFDVAAARLMVSDGAVDRAGANHTRQRWIYFGGAGPDGQAGVAVLVHPASFRAPQPVRVHPQTPFVCFTPQAAGEWEITPAAPYRAHYRIVVLDGAPERARLERLWQAFASVPPPADPAGGA